jgi:hypothetical protein
LKLFHSIENDLNPINFCLFLSLKSFNILVLFPVPGSQHQQDFPQLQLNAPQIPRTHQPAFQLLLKDPEKRAYEPITISLYGRERGATPSSFTTNENLFSALSEFALCALGEFRPAPLNAKLFPLPRGSNFSPLNTNPCVSIIVR